LHLCGRSRFCGFLSSLFLFVPSLTNTELGVFQISYCSLKIYSTASIAAMVQSYSGASREERGCAETLLVLYIFERRGFYVHCILHSPSLVRTSLRSGSCRSSLFLFRSVEGGEVVGSFSYSRDNQAPWSSPSRRPGSSTWCATCCRQTSGTWSWI
jgi:hypothetical protein